MEYTIEIASDVEKLIKLVNIRLADSWQLQGGVSISNSESDDYKYTWFAQALTREIAGESPIVVKMIDPATGAWKVIN